MSNEKLEGKRWWIAAAAVVMQLLLGTVYAWSVFKLPMMKAHGWTETATQATFMICIGVLGVSCAFGGILVDKKGPKFVATLGGILFGVGTLIAGLADHTGNIILLYFGYGLLGGIGNGFGYVTPIATLIRWFPDRRGLVTGLAVMGFGLGAFFMGKIAPLMIQSLGVANTFFALGVIFLVCVPLAAQMYKNPPKGWIPAGFTAPKGTTSAADSLTINQAVKTPQWWILWMMLFLNVSAGIGLISQLSPMAQDLIKKIQTDITPADLAIAGGTIMAIAAIFNGLGRLIWAWISDAIGRKAVFSIMFLSQAALYVYLPNVSSIVIFTIIASYLLSCFGGGFATMPAFAADAFGPAYIGRVYGMILIAWGAAGVVGPLVFARVKEATQNFEGALFIAAGMLMVGFILALVYKKPASKNS